jgi:hypothetical protein
MKLVVSVLFVVLVVVSLPHGGNQVRASEPRASTSTAAGEMPAPIVVELFTSEGCSSCPPADALLAKLDATQPAGGAQIIAIEEHVDYWNYLGWADPFSSGQWTARQQNYETAFRQDGEYTPQMIVAGHYEFVGSRSDLAAKAIEEARQLTAVRVSLERTGSKNLGEPRFAVMVGKSAELAPKDTAEVWIAVTESGLASQVSRGENAGRNLRHAPVLRWLQLIGTAEDHSDGASFQREVPVKLRPEWNREHLTVVVLVQEKKSRHILGAAAQKVAG